MSDIKKTVITSMLIALGIVMPMIFHLIPQGLGGRVLLPMHIPVFLAGLVVGPFFGFFAGLITPLLSSMITGMPAAGIAVYRMMVELSVYGLAAGLAMRLVHTKRLTADLYISLVAAMLAGRIVAGLFQAFVFLGGGSAFVFGLWVSSYFYSSIPGIVLQIIFVPTIVIALERGRLIPTRYPKVAS
ncbi:MAG: ECF transporter S component [Defluviitaleaceae bacterium]|nr:ECF transporter S component [Defluviitaleaceae bacterium]